MPPADRKGDPIAHFPRGWKQGLQVPILITEFQYRGCSWRRRRTRARRKTGSRRRPRRARLRPPPLRPSPRLPRPRAGWCRRTSGAPRWCRAPRRPRGLPPRRPRGRRPPRPRPRRQRPSRHPPPYLPPLRPLRGPKARRRRGSSCPRATVPSSSRIWTGSTPPPATKGAGGPKALSRSSDRWPSRRTRRNRNAGPSSRRR